MKNIKFILRMCILFVVIMLGRIEVEAAQELPLNTAVQISTAEGVYQFTIKQHGKVTLKATPAIGKGSTPGQIELYARDEEQNEKCLLAERGNYGTDSFETTAVRLSPGTYTIKYTNGTMVNTSTYFLNLTIQYIEENPDSFETENNDTWSTADCIDLNKEYTANLQTYSDIDIYQFNLEQEGSVVINFRYIGAKANCFMIQLYAEEENKNISLIDIWKNTELKVSRFTKYRLPKGRYYIKVFNDWFANYTVDDYSIGTTYVAETSDNSEIEYNNTIADANVIKANVEYKGNIPTPKEFDYYLNLLIQSETTIEGIILDVEDIDYFRLDIDKTSNIQIQLRQENDKIIPNLYQVAFYRQNSDGTLVLYNRFNTTDDKVNKGECTTVPVGTYIICIKQYYKDVKDEDKSDYYLKVEQTESSLVVPVPENIKDVAGQSGIPLAVNTKNLICVEEGRYIFSIPEEGNVSIIASKLNGYIELYRIDEDENEILVSEGKSVYPNEVIESVTLQAGTYIIKYKDSEKGTANLQIIYNEIVDLSKIVVTPIGDKTYTGDEIKPKLSVTYKGKRLEENNDYKITYKNNIKCGTATITLKPISGISKGEKKVTFQIKERAKDKVEKNRVINTKAKIKSIKKVNSKTCKIKLSGLSKCTGYQIQYGTSKNFKKAKSIKTKKSTVNMTTSKLKRGKKYYIRVRTYKKICGKTYYGKWSGKKTFKFKK